VRGELGQAAEQIAGLLFAEGAGFFDQFGGRRRRAIDHGDADARGGFAVDERVANLLDIERVAQQLTGLAADDSGADAIAPERGENAGGIDAFSRGRHVDGGCAIDGIEREAIEFHRARNGRRRSKRENHAAPFGA